MDWTDNNILFTSQEESKPRKYTVPDYGGNRGDETYRVESNGNIRNRQASRAVVEDNENSTRAVNNARTQDGSYFQQTKSSPQMETTYGVLVEGETGYVKTSTSRVREKSEGLSIASRGQAEDDLLLDIWGLKESDLSGKLHLGHYTWKPTQASELKFSGNTQADRNVQYKRQTDPATEAAGNTSVTEPRRHKSFVEHKGQLKDGTSALVYRSDLLDASQTESQIEELGLKTHRPSARPMSPLKVTTNFRLNSGTDDLDARGKYFDSVNKREQTEETAEARNNLGEGSREFGRKVSFEEKTSPMSRARIATSPQPRRIESTRDFIRRSWDKNDFARQSPPQRVHQRKHSSHSKTSSSPERHLEAVRFYVEQKLRKGMEEEQVAREGSVTGEEESRTDFVARWVQSVENCPEDTAQTPRLLDATEESPARGHEKEDPQLSPVSRTLKNLGLGHVKFRAENPTVQGQTEVTKIDTRNSDTVKEDGNQAKESTSPLLSPVSRTLRKLGFGYMKGSQDGATNGSKRLLVKICPNCTEDNDLDAAWCTECGSALVGMESSPSNHHHGDVTTPSNSTPGAPKLQVNDLQAERFKLFQGEANQNAHVDNNGRDSRHWDWQGSPSKDDEHTVNISDESPDLERAIQQHTASVKDIKAKELPPVQSSDKIIFERSRHDRSGFAETDSWMTSSHHKQFPSKEELRLALDSDSSDDDRPKGKRKLVPNTNIPIDARNSRNVDARENVLVENEPQESFEEGEEWNTHPYGRKERHVLTKPGERAAPQLQQSKEPQLRKGKQKPQSASQGASYITQGYKRHWQRSSIAWDSYNPGELNTRSSVVKSGEKRKNAGAKQRTVGFDLSTESASSTSGDSKPSRRRPASAGQRSTGQGSSSGERSVNASGGQRPWSASRSSTAIREFEEDFLSIHSASFSTGKGSSKPVMKYHLDNQTYAKILTMTPRGDSDESPWLFLPDELLLYILGFLSQSDLARVASTCQHFYRVAMDESLWRNITLTKRTDLSDEMLGYIGQHSPQTLRLLQCTGTTVTERGLRDLFKGCKDSLKELNFSGCSGGALTGDLVLLHASSRCHNITSLDASWSNATNNGAMAVADISKRLEVLCVNGCQSITDEALNYVVNRHGGTLQVLEVFGCFNITQQCLLGMAQTCPNLRVLNMGQCYKVTDKLIRQMAGKLKSLEVWDLRGCKQVQDESVHQIVRCCSRLQTVTLANCPLVTDVALVEIATYLPNVRCVDVSGCRNVTDSGVRAFANNSKQLAYIDLSSTAITTKSVTLLGSYCNRTLETVKLCFCDITESAVVKLVKNCPRLQTLHVIGCKRIRNDGAIKVANSKLAVELGRK
ncbi:hypothetical protein Bbelb_189430 [Branchiostoma belcheri]|nr:hypothetical protein Bbelb_189430 [Branchiostoma belcheri]